MALKSCNEIGSAKTLFQFMSDLLKIQGAQVPSQKSVRQIRDNAAFKNFLQSVIICTEEDYKLADLERLARSTHELKYEYCYKDLLDDIIK